MTFAARGLAAALAVVVLSGTTVSLRAQSLADVAKKEEERRKAVKESGKSYTNSDLHSVPPATANSTSCGMPNRRWTRRAIVAIRGSWARSNG